MGWPPSGGSTWRPTASASRRRNRAIPSTGGHRARRVTADDLASADLVVVAERFHIGRLEQLCPDANYVLINDFNPAMPKGQDLDDPWYGPASGFRSTLADIEAAMPGILDALA